MRAAHQQRLGAAPMCAPLTALGALLITLLPVLLCACSGAPVSTRPDPLPADLRPVEAPEALGDLDATLTVEHVKAEADEVVRVIRLSEIFDAIYQDPDGWLVRAAALAQAVQGCAEHQQVPEDGRVALLCGWLPWPYADLRPPHHWLGLPYDFSLVEQHAAAASDDVVAASWRQRDAARRAALQGAIVYFELWLEFAVYSAEAAHHRVASALVASACGPAQDTSSQAPGQGTSPARRASPLDCAVSQTLSGADGTRLHRLRARWALRSDILGSLLDLPAATLLAPTRDVHITPRVRTDQRDRLLDAAEAAVPSLQAIHADQRRAALQSVAAWWALTGIVVGGIENPVLGNTTLPIGGFTIILDLDYFRNAWIALQGARSNEAVKSLHSDMHAEEVVAAVDAALARLAASHLAALDALAMLRDAEASTADLTRRWRALDPTVTLTLTLTALHKTLERRAAAFAAVLHYNLSHLEVLAALGHLTAP
jgi:hypothetical protein